MIHDAVHNSVMLKDTARLPIPLKPRGRDTDGLTDTRGKQALFLGRRPHAYVVGLSVDESNQLLDEVWSHATDLEWTWHNEWEVGDLVMWQNHLVMHRRDAFDGSTRRIMHRTQLKIFAI